MTKNLVTTGLKETFDDNSLNVLLGAWCNPLKINSELYKNTEVCDYHWNDTSKLEKDYDYLHNLYEKTIKLLTTQMNKIHNEKHSERYWRIVLGPWLQSLTSILWDRWETLRVAIEKSRADTTKLIDYNTKSLIASDFIEFSKLRNEHYWNHIIFSEIIKFNYSEKIKVKKVVSQEKQDNFKYIANYHYYPKKLKINYFIKFFDSIIKTFLKKPKIILYESYFGLINKILLSFSLGEIPRIFSEFRDEVKMPEPKDRNNIKFDFDAKDQFENFYKLFLFKLMPISYLEGYKILQEKSKKTNTNVKVIFTCTGHEDNDLFKIWVANQVRVGKKYILCEHGGSWEKSEYFGILEKTSDLFLSWNRYNFKNCIQVPINIDLKNKKILKKNIGSKVLLLSNFTTLYCVRIHTGPITAQILQDYELWKTFTQKLSPKIKENIIFRNHPLDVWDLKKKYSVDIGEKNVSNEKYFEKDVNRSKIIVNTSLQTTFYQSMKKGIPTILLFDRKILNIDPKLLKLRDLLIKNKIFFSSPHEASKHINKIWNNPLVWWNSNQVLEVRNLFSEYCSVEKENNFKYWKKLLKNQING